MANHADGTATTPALRTVRVELAARAYDVVIGSGALATLGDVLRALRPRATKALVAMDSGVPGVIAGRAVGSLAGVGVNARTESLVASEQGKSIETLGVLLSAAMTHRLERDEPVISLGGGIVGDVAGFAAASYRRGVPFVQCPTTLLAMVDAAVGGKVGINLRVEGSGAGELRKNMAGAFWQPLTVLCDIDALASLPEIEYTSGLAECVKHGTIGAQCGDAELLAWMREKSALIASRDGATLTELVARNVAVKARVVAADEREESTDPNGGRMALNAGHTVAHALEALSARRMARGVGGDEVNRRQDASRHHHLTHGHAVGLGLIAEMQVGERAGVTSQGASDEVQTILNSLGLPVRFVDGEGAADEVIRAMGDDKKVQAGQVRLSLPTGRGECRMLRSPRGEDLRAGLRMIGIT